MKRGSRGRRRDKQKAPSRPREFTKWKKWKAFISEEKLRAVMRDHPNHYETVVVNTLHSLKVPLELWELVYVLMDFGKGRTVFRATDDELAEHGYKLVVEGKVQAFLRRSVDGTDEAHRAAVERVVADLEADLLRDEPRG